MFVYQCNMVECVDDLGENWHIEQVKDAIEQSNTWLRIFFSETLKQSKTWLMGKWGFCGLTILRN